MVITIDGPSGVGKTVVAWRVATVLGFDLLDTGAMYRAIGLAALRRQSNLDDPKELLYVARHAHISFDWTQRPPVLILGGEVVEKMLRTPECSDAASKVAVVEDVRKLLVDQQRAIARERGDVVSEGRDQGSVVFPEALLKIFLKADLDIRVDRRLSQLRRAGVTLDRVTLRRQMAERDNRDEEREVAPLKPTPDARIVDSTHLTEDHVVDTIVRAARERLPITSHPTSEPH